MCTSNCLCGATSRFPRWRSLGNDCAPAQTTPHTAPSAPSTEGPAKKNRRTPPRTFAKSQTHQPASRLFFSLAFFLVRFGRFSARGVQKRHKNIWAKSPCRKLFPKKIETNSMSVVSFSSAFLFYRVFGCFSAMGDGSSKTLQKTFCKKIVSESFYKKFDQKPKAVYSRFFCYVLGRFSVGGVQKHDKKTKKYRNRKK
jgi:hypothetical protein